MKVAFVFPGQGSQSVGMLDSFVDVPEVRQTLDEANAILGFDLAGLIANGPMEDLSMTVNTQPAMLTASVALTRAWRAQGGIEPVVAAGHSLGEYSALTAMGALTLEQALPLVRTRAQLMQTEVPAGTGGMAAVLGLDDEVIVKVCESLREQGAFVQAVNFNSPGQVVIAGTTQGLDAAQAALKDAGARRVMVLPVSAPFHSELMKPAAQKLGERLSQTAFQAPSVPVLSNVDAQPHTVENMAAMLERQAASPVQWVDTLARFVEMGVTDVVEMGPGNVLLGLLKRAQPTLKGHSVKDRASFEAALSALNA